MNYIELACDMIRNYLNVAHDETWTNDYITEKYSTAVVIIEMKLKNLYEGGTDGKIVTSMTEGSRSITFDSSENQIMSDIVKSLLPLPFVRLF